MKKKIEVSRSTSFFDGLNGNTNGNNNNNRVRGDFRRFAESPNQRQNNTNSSIESFSNYNLLVKNPFKHHMRVSSISPSGNFNHYNNNNNNKDYNLNTHRVWKLFWKIKFKLFLL